jgi:hypothetical protein
VSVPDDKELSVEMSAENWAFGAVRGDPREAALRERPAGTEKPVVGS